MVSAKVQRLQSLPPILSHDTQHIVDTIALVNRMKVTMEMKSFNDEFNNCKYSVPNCKTTILCCDRYDDPASTKDYTRQSWAAAGKKNIQSIEEETLNEACGEDSISRT